MKKANNIRSFDAFLEELSDHINARLDARCLPKPYGCGGSAKKFSTQTAINNYKESGLCERCQTT